MGNKPPAKEMLGRRGLALHSCKTYKVIVVAGVTAIFTHLSPVLHEMG
jgi:hypothetical protein